MAISYFGGGYIVAAAAPISLFKYIHSRIHEYSRVYTFTYLTQSRKAINDMLHVFHVIAWTQLTTQVVS